MSSAAFQILLRREQYRGVRSPIELARNCRSRHPHPLPLTLSLQLIHNGYEESTQPSSIQTSFQGNHPLQILPKDNYNNQQRKVGRGNFGIVLRAMLAMLFAIDTSL
jgi:hypothetical protein